MYQKIYFQILYNIAFIAFYVIAFQHNETFDLNIG